MKILVIGDSRDTANACTGMRFAGDGHDASGGGLVHYADAHQALRELERGVDSYGWVLVENSGNALATAEAVWARRAGMPVAVFSNVAGGQGGRQRTAPALCAVETTCDGMQILRCALHRASLQPDGQRALHEAIDTQPLVFEYHAPCRKVT